MDVTVAPTQDEIAAAMQRLPNANACPHNIEVVVVPRCNDRGIVTSAVQIAFRRYATGPEGSRASEWTWHWEFCG
jgi:hypothetical protein